MVKLSDELIQEIVKLGKGNIEEQLKAQLLCNKKIFPAKKCVDPTVIDKILPFVFRCIGSENIILQIEGTYYLSVITQTSYANLLEKDFTKMCIGAIENLLKLFVSEDFKVLESAFICLDNIGIDFPEILKENIKKYGYENLVDRRKHKNRRIASLSKRFYENYVEAAEVDNEIDMGESSEQESVEFESASSSFDGSQKGQRKRKLTIKQNASKKAKPSTRRSAINGDDHFNWNAVDNDEELYNNDFDYPSRNSSPVQQNISSPQMADDLIRNNDDVSFPLHINTAENDGTNLNFVKKRSPGPPIVLFLPSETPINNGIGNNPSNVIATFDIPSGYFIRSCCEQLGISYDRSQYLKFLAKIKFTEINTTSKPASCLHSTNDRSGFWIFSMIFCGKDDPQIADKIKQTINDRFMDKNYGLIDKATFISVINSSTLKEEHIKFIVEHFKFRILVYFNEEWKKFGVFGDEETPLFLLGKKVAQDGINNQIVLSLEN